MRTEELIARLGGAVTPVKPLASPVRRLLLWLAWVVPVLAVIVAAMGLHPDVPERWADPRWATQIIASALTGLCAAWAALASTVPGISRWRLALPVPPALVWLGSVGLGCLNDWVVRGADSLLPAIKPQCLPEITVISIAPLAVLVILSRRGAALRPHLTACLTALAAAALASAVLDQVHRADAAIVTLVWHFGGVALLSGLATLFGRRLFPAPMIRR